MLTLEKIVQLRSFVVLQRFCRQQMDQAYQKNDDKMADQLSQKIDAMEKTRGPEYAALIGGLQDQLGAKFMSAVASLDGLCTRYVSKKPKAPATLRAIDHSGL